MAVAQPNLPIGPTTGPLNPDFDVILNNQTQSGITFNIQDYKNKYLDGEGVQKLWKRTLEEIKLSVNSASAKIIPLDFTNGTSIEFNSSSTNEEDQAILAILMGLGTQDIMVWEGNRTYYCTSSTKNSAYWRNYTLSGINVVSCTLTLNSDETKVTKAVFSKGTEKYLATALVGNGGSLTYDNLKNAVTANGTFSTDQIIVGNNNDRTVKAGGMTLTNLIAIAEGATNSYIVKSKEESFTLASSSITPQPDANAKAIKVSKILDLQGIEILLSSLKTGDIILVQNTEEPDWYVGKVYGLDDDGNVTTDTYVLLLELETRKIDLSGYQPKDADLTAIAGLTGGGLLKRNSDNTWGLDATAYAGGTAVTLNGTSKAGSTATFYAPTAAGTANQVLISNGSNKAPTWTSQGNITAGKVGKSISFTDNDWTITDGPSYDGSEAIVVTADDVGAVPIKRTGKPYSGHIGYTGNCPLIYTSNADGDTLSAIGVSHNLISLAVGESYFEITADSITFKENKIVDYSMTLTTTEIDTILANS